MNRFLAPPWLVLLAAGCPAAPDMDSPFDDGPPPYQPPAPVIDVHDPLSMPENPTLSESDFLGAESCASCHPNHYAEWSTSMHAYGMLDPVFRRAALQRQADYGGQQDQFCHQCHSAIGTRSGDIEDNFAYEELSDITLEGITCEACHKVKALERPYNSGHVFDPKGPMRATIDDPVAAMAHGTEKSELHGQSQFCAGCHDVYELDGLPLERPYAEWLESPSFEAEQTCQDCHMPAYSGKAATMGPERTVHRHTFVGAGLPLLDGFLDAAQYDTRRTEVTDFMRSAATLQLDAPLNWERGKPFDILLTVYNDIDGHSLPTGSTFNRQMWLDVTATDADGTVLFRTGDFDDNGDLRNFWSELDPWGDEDLVMLTSTLSSEQGDPVLFSWDALEHTTGAIQAGHDRTYTMFVPTNVSAKSPITVTAKLRFRQFPPYLLRALGLDGFVEKLEVIDMDEATADVVLD